MFDIANIAKLARLETDESQAPALEGQIREILAYVDALQKVDSSSIQGYGLSEGATIWRPDEVIEPTPAESKVSLSASHREGMFFVPKVIGDGEA